MKKIFTLLLSGMLLGLCLTACGGHDKDQMDRDEKLLLLDAKIKRSPKDADLYYQRGKLLLEKEMVNDAIADFKKAVELDDDEVTYYTALGDAYFANGNVGDSYTTLQKALKLDENNLEALLKMGEISFYSRDYDRAIETLSKVTKIDENNRTALYMKGFVYLEKGDTSNAVGLLTKVTDLYPDYEPAFEQLGILYASKHDKLAVDYLNTALKLQPKNINVLYGLAMLYQDLEDPEKANEYYVKILEIDPHNATAWHNRGYMELVLYNDYDAAIEFFTKAIDADNQYVEAHTNRGVAYEQKGDRRNAEICYRAALQIDPNYPLAKEGMARLGK